MDEQAEIDLQIWEYIDGNCNNAESTRIMGLITVDPVWAERYRELNTFHTSVIHELELEQPSMRFTKNVMDMIALSTMEPVAKKYINQFIIRGIAAFFLISIAVVISVALFSMTWNVPSIAPAPQFSLPDLHIAKLLNTTVIKVAITINVVLGLIFADLMLRNRSRIKHT